MVTFSECALMFLGMALYFGISWRRAATKMIKEIGTWSGAARHKVPGSLSL